LTVLLLCSSSVRNESLFMLESWKDEIMMITEIPARLPGAGRLARGRRLPSDLVSLSGRKRWAGRGGLPPDGGTGAFDPALRRNAPSNGPLTCLTDNALAKRFHAWSGTSGRRYICSVFPLNAEEPEAGLPDFADAIVIAVGNDAGLRRPLAFFEFSGETVEKSEQQREFVDKALASSVQEWHIHLLATDPAHRQAVKADLEKAWLDTAAS
jgi:hypothetical protein